MDDIYCNLYEIYMQKNILPKTRPPQFTKRIL